MVAGHPQPDGEVLQSVRLQKRKSPYDEVQPEEKTDIELRNLNEKPVDTDLLCNQVTQQVMVKSSQQAQGDQDELSSIDRLVFGSKPG